MDRTETSARRVRTAAQALLALLLAALVYRAATQAVTHDEALTWIAHVGGPGARPFEAGANNHVLFTQLARLSTQLLGPGELALRLPTLLGALLYLVALARLARRALPSPGAYAAGVGLAALNPYVLDFLVAARGYGLGLGLSLAALDQLHAWCGDRRRTRLVLAGAALGLAVAAQLTFLPLAGALVVARALREACVSPRPAGGRARAGLQAALAVGLAALVAGGPWVGILLVGMEPGELYGGVESLAESGRLLAERSLLHARDEHVPGRPEWVHALAALATYGALPALLVGVLAALPGTLRRGLRSSDEWTGVGAPADLLLLAGAAVWLVPAGLVVSVRLAPLLGMTYEYPDARRCVGYLPVFALATAALAQRLVDAPGTLRHAGRLVLVAAAALVLRFAWQLETGWFADWRYDAGARRIFEQIEAHRRGARREEPARIAVQPWIYQSALSYYRDVRDAEGWLAPVERFPRLGQGGYDYFVLDPDTEPEVARAVAEPLYRDPVSGVWLFVPRAPAED